MRRTLTTGLIAVGASLLFAGPATADKFRTTGNYSAATVRGTEWLVQDSCSGTLTRVTQGVVAVRDNVKNKTVLVRGPRGRYTAKPRGR